jgi:hypothetical protein
MVLYIAYDAFVGTVAQAITLAYAQVKVKVVG